MRGADDAWEAMQDAIDLDRTQATVLERMFGEPAPATKLGRFTVLGIAGEGQMGRVYIAHDPELDRKVAIKLIRRFGLVDAVIEKRRARMLREAQAMAKVRHPNVIAVYEVGRLGDDAFIVMDYVPGPSLREWLAQRQRPWQELLPTFIGAGRGLAAAHARDLVHRDFKPDNVLVAADDGQSERAIVLDFGLARQPVGTGSDPSELPSGSILSSDLTATGATLGTPAYMAPEQMAGVASDARSDQFSYCVALFEAVHGLRPYTGASWEHVIAKIRTGEPPMHRPIPDWLQAALTKGLQYDPDARHRSMDVLLHELVRRRVSRRGALGIGLGALGIAAAGAAGSTWLLDDTPSCDAGKHKAAAVWGPAQRAAMTEAFARSELAYARTLSERVAKQLDEHVDRWKAMHRDTCEATHVRHEQSDQLLDLRAACLDRRLSETRAVVEVLTSPDATTIERAANIAAGLGGLDQCADAEQLLAGTPLPTDPGRRRAIVDAEDRVVEARALMLAARYDEASDALGEVEAEGIGPTHGPLQARILLTRGTLQMRRGDNNAERTLLDAVSAAEAAREDHVAMTCWRLLTERTRGNKEAARRSASYLERFDASVARLGSPAVPHAQLERARGVLADRDGRYDDAANHWRAALALIPAQVRPATSATLRLDLATVLFRQGDYAAAEAEFDQLIDVYSDLHGPDHPFTGRAVGNRGAALVALGRNEEAIPILERAVAIKKGALGPDHEGVATVTNTLASAYYQLGNFAAARTLYAEALRISEVSLGETDARLGTPLANLARTQSHLGEDDAAIASALRALEIVETARGPEHIEVAGFVTGLGHVYARAGRLDDAVAALRRALKLRTEQLGPDHVESAQSERSLADALHRLGQEHEAIGFARHAAQSVEASLGEAHPQLASALLTLGRIEFARGRMERAREQLERSLSIYEDVEAPPPEIAEAKFALARVLAETPGGRARAIELATEAGEILGAAGAANQELREQIQQALEDWSS